ncbi:MAG: ABC transporter substrate-binding protein [Rhizobacter sp.]|nr:ABC transporter substrate-binding protein [Chlorobiales bacterium]
MNQRIFFIAYAALCVSISAGCGGNKPSATGDATYREAKGGKVYGGTYTFNEPQDLPTLDPIKISDVTSYHATHQMYELLVELDQKDLKLVPELASRWEISPDGLTYTFHLRTDVYFHDDSCFVTKENPTGKGRKFVASDVKFSWERACNPQLQTKGFSIFQSRITGADDYYLDRRAATAEKREPRVKEVKGFEVVNDSTFAVHLQKPFGPFLVTLTHTTCYIVPPEAVGYYKENFRMHPVGTGAFVYEAFKDGQYLLMKRNPNYWQKDEAGNQLPFVDHVKMVFIRDLTTALMQVKQGAVSECYRIPQELRSQWLDGSGQALKAEFKKEFTLQQVPGMATQFYSMNTQHELFKDKRIRQAFSYAVDRDKISKFVLKGESYASAIHGVVPPAMPAPSASAAPVASAENDQRTIRDGITAESSARYPYQKITGYDFNPEKAKALLAEAGYPNGENFPEITLQINSGGGRNFLVAQAVQEMLKQNLNIKIELFQSEWAQHLETLQNGKAPFARLGWVADYPEPENFLNQFYGKLIPKNRSEISFPNTSRYNNPAFDKLYEEALATSNDSLRFVLYEQAEQLAMQDAPLLLLFYDLDERIISGDVRDYPMNAMDRRDLKTVWLDRLAPKPQATK